MQCHIHGLLIEFLDLRYPLFQPLLLALVPHLELDTTLSELSIHETRYADLQLLQLTPVLVYLQLTVSDPVHAPLPLFQESVVDCLDLAEVAQILFQTPHL